MQTPLWAHSVNDAGRRHSLTDHLRGTAALARKFATSIGAGDLAEGLGLLHDAGKAACAWQQGLREVEGTNRTVGKDHKSLGARMLAPVAGPAVMAILGHHGGLTCRDDLKNVVLGTLAADEAATQATARDALCAAVPEVPRLLSGGHLMPTAWREPSVLEMGLRLVFSALVDADHLDTAAHFADMSAPEVAEPTDMVELAHRFETARALLLRDRPPSPVDDVRDELYRAAVEAASGRPGLYRLPAPTGSGKTMTAAAFALHHAAAHGKSRVIIAVPFVTITEQNAQVYRDLLGNVVLEHHSNTELDGRRARLGAENWDAPFVVTTTVQLFDSLFGRKPARSRKLHRLANAVIVLDEVQSLPVPLLVPILDALSVLTEHFGSTVLLASATQPAFEHLQVWNDKDIVPIIQNPAIVYEKLRRVRYEWWLDPEPSDDEVADRVSGERQALVVVNTTRAAREMFALLVYRVQGSDSIVRHLSTRMCSAHRKAVLDEVRALLADDEPVLLVSTQLIESGVDVDFPVVYRAAAPADSLQQAAGRANREGRRPEPGRVIVFASAHSVPDYRTPVAQTMLHFGPDRPDPDDLDALRRYYQGLYNAQNIDNGERARSIQDHRRKLDFTGVADGPLVDASLGKTRNARLAFRMLDDDTVPVVVTKFHTEAEALLDELRRADAPNARPRRATFRALQRYVVSLPRHVVDRPEVWALCEQFWVGSDLLVWRGDYHEQYGIDETATVTQTVW